MPEHKSEGSIVQTMVAAGMVDSNSDAHRKIREGAITLNGKKVADAKQKDKPGDILRVGRKFLKIK